MKRNVLFLLAIVAFNQHTDALQPQRGYRGFVEWSSSLRSTKFGMLDINGNLITHRENMFFTGLATSHGYQINPMFFVGAGIGMERCTNLDNWVVPVFAQSRVDLDFGGFTPFADMRLGANLAEGTGVYFSPSVGYRFNWGRKAGVNIGAGLTLAGYTAEHYELSWEDAGGYELYYVGREHHVRPYFSFRLGLDF